MANRPMGRPTTARHKERVNILSDWHATPEPLREQVHGATNLHQLALNHGEIPNRHWYKLADSAEVYHDALVKTAGQALDKVPAILSRLSEDALEGKTRAAEVFLDFVRKTITDEGFLQKLKPITDIGQLFNRVAANADRFIQMADKLGDNPVEAAARWEEMRNGAVDAEYTLDGPTSDPEPTEPRQPDGCPIPTEEETRHGTDSPTSPQPPDGLRPHHDGDHEQHRGLLQTPGSGRELPLDRQREDHQNGSTTDPTHDPEETTEPDELQDEF